MFPQPTRFLADGARHLTIAGRWLYVSTPDSVVVLDMDEPLKPKLLKVLPFEDPRATALQFRYLFVTDAEGLKVVDVTHPEDPRPVPGAVVRSEEHTSELQSLMRHSYAVF